jgi:hypothetical protein
LKCVEDEKISQATFEKLQKEVESPTQHSGEHTYFPDFSAYVTELAFEHTTRYVVKNEISNLLAFA